MRNHKNQHLLTGLIKCASCRRNYGAAASVHHKNGREYPRRCYKCGTRTNRLKTATNSEPCTQGQITCHILGSAVWTLVVDSLLDPSVVLAALERRYAGEGNAEIAATVAHLEGRLAETSKAIDRLVALYEAGEMEMEEYRERWRAHDTARDGYRRELARLNGLMGPYAR